MHRKPDLILSILICVLISCATAPIQQLTTGERAPDFTLSDQYDQKFTLSQFNGQIVLLLGCDRYGAEYASFWMQSVEQKYSGKMQILKIINGRGVPFFLKGRVKKALRVEVDGQRIPSILLDWKGKVFRSYGMRPKTCNLVLIDKSGFIRHFQSVTIRDDVKLRVLFKEIDKIISL